MFTSKNSILSIFFLRVCAPHALAGLLYTAAPQDVRVAPTTSHTAVLLGTCVDILALCTYKSVNPHVLVHTGPAPSAYVTRATQNKKPQVRRCVSGSAVIF